LSPPARRRPVLGRHSRGVSVAVIIVAAGSGTRLGLHEPKAFVPLGPHPILYYSLRTVARLPEIGEIVVTAPRERVDDARALAAAATAGVSTTVLAGGAERRDSVRIGLSQVSANADIVVIHDAARPFAPPEIFRACIEAAARTGAALACVPVADTLKQASGNLVVATRSRQELHQAQTPQAFTRSVLLAAHAQTGIEAATDDAYLVEQMGAQVEIVSGSPLNFKITTADDLRIARALLAGDPRLAAQFV